MAHRFGRFWLVLLLIAAFATGCAALEGIGATVGLPVSGGDRPAPDGGAPTAPAPGGADDGDGAGAADGHGAGVDEAGSSHAVAADKPSLPPKARMAIVIDDLGAGQAGSEELLAFPLPLTFAVLPGTPFAHEVVATAQANGHTVLLHLPMEPVNVADNNPGSDAIYVAMTDQEIREQTAWLLEQLPGVVGVNNHMGSAATADARVMAAVLAEVQARGLFFLDSRTTAASVVAEEAERIGLPYAVNDLFLDLERTVPAVKAMIAEAIERALAHGTFIAIAHPHPSVADAFYEMIPEFEAAGVALVPVTELLRYPGE